MARKPAFHHAAAALAMLIAASGMPAHAAPAGQDRQAAPALHLPGALNDRELTGIRGGFSPAPGITLNFAFQQSTYQNHQLIQSTIIPDSTIRLSPSGGAALVQQATRAASGPSASALAGAGTAPAAVLTEIGPGGITNVIRNTSNNQLVQQMTSISIGVSGLSQLLSRQAQAMTLDQTMIPGH
ncbi:MAG TPA: hypothetical protein VFN77_01545 [Acetobacteraceae bacterium]|nr:hypothetical protein [Acetobacteraceae bacterium]